LVIAIINQNDALSVNKKWVVNILRFGVVSLLRNRVVSLSVISKQWAKDNKIQLEILRLGFSGIEDANNEKIYTDDYLTYSEHGKKFFVSKIEKLATEYKYTLIRIK